MTPAPGGTRPVYRFAHALRALVVLAVLVLLSVPLTIGGCATVPKAEHDKLVSDHQAALDEARRLTESNAELQTKVADQQKHIRTLQNLGDKRIEKLFAVARIELGRHTGGVDRDGKPGHDAIKVYLTPIDRHGSVVKAAGDVTVQLYDLADDPKKNLIGEYKFGVDDIHKHWFSGFISYHYSFPCPWKDASPPKHETITVRVEFVDYLTGKTFTAQKTCKIKLPPTVE